MAAQRGESLKKNQEVICLIDALGAQGEGICHELGQVLFVPGALPGERARVRVQKAGPSLAYGKLLELLSESPERVKPPCPYFGRCGGCALQHMAYSAQLRYKTEQVASCMHRIAKLPVVASPALGMDEPWRYRNKTALPVQMADGQPAAGYYAPRSHRLVPVSGCLIARPECDSAVNAVIAWMRRHGVSAYREENGQGLVRHIITRVNTLGEVMVTIAINSRSLPHAAELAEALKTALPGFHSLHLTPQTAGDNVILGEAYETLYGSSSFTDEVCGLKFELSPLSFSQVNSQVSQRLYRDALAQAELTSNDRVLDLYSGAGAIALMAAGQCREAIGVEISPQAVENARANADRNHADNAVFHQGEAEKILPRLQSQGLAADVIFLDPPRKGAHPDVLCAAAAASPRRILYISCHPASQARDAAILSGMGYRVSRCQPYDMFCQTAEAENLLRFDRVREE